MDKTSNIGLFFLIEKKRKFVCESNRRPNFWVGLPGSTAKTNDDWRWVNGGEKKLIGSYTEQECIDTVRQQHPTANGATMQYPCTNKCDCYAGYKKGPPTIPEPKRKPWKGSYYYEIIKSNYKYRACKFDNE